MKKERQSNFELMRLVSMFFIVVYHFLIHTGIESMSHGFVKILFQLLTCIILVHVNSFVLITGYFQVDSKFNIKKIFSLNNADWFYRVFYLILFTILTNKFGYDLIFHDDKIFQLRLLSPIDHDIYWFLNNYLILYLFSPVLNITINKLNKKQYLKLLLLFLIIFSIIPTITSVKDLFLNNGRCLIAFVFLYLLGAYMKKYPLDKAFFLNKLSINSQKIIYVFVFFFCALLALSCMLLGPIFISGGTVMKIINDILYNLHISYLSPLVILQTIAYFMIFKSINIKSKFINSLSKYLFGIYLVHENIFVRENLAKIININQFYGMNYKLLIITLVFSIGIFILSFIVEFIRQKIFKFIYNRKISKKLSKKFYDFIYSVKLE